MMIYKIKKEQYNDIISMLPTSGHKQKNLYSNSIASLDDITSLKSNRIFEITKEICDFLDNKKVQYRIVTFPAGVSYHYNNSVIESKPYLVKNKKYFMQTFKEDLDKFSNGLFLYKVIIDDSCMDGEFKLRFSTITLPNLLDEFPKFEFY